MVIKINDETNSSLEIRIFLSSKQIETKKEAISNEAYLIGKYKCIVRFKSFEGEFRLNLRKLNENGNATIAGIVLDKAQFESFASFLPQLEEKLEDTIRGNTTNFKKDIGGNAMIKVNDDYGCIDVRHYYFDRNDSSRKPIKRGVTFNKNECDVVKSLLYTMMISVQKHVRDNERKDDAIEKETMGYFEF